MLCGGCLFPTRNTSAAGAAVEPGKSSEMMTITGACRGGDAHKSERYLPYFAGYDLSSNLRHLDAKREEDTEGLIDLIYNRFDSRVYSTDLTRTFIALGGDSGRGGVGLELGGGGLNCYKNKDNSAVNGRGCRRRAASVSSLFCTKSVGMWRASYSDQEDAMNGGDVDEDSAWEPA